MKANCLKLGILVGLLVALPLVFPLGKAWGDSEFFKDPPILAKKVADGLLPKINERLPSNPVLLEPEESLGVYGGTWNLAMRGNKDRAFVYRSIDYEPLFRWDPSWKGVLPNIAQSVSTNPEATQFTIHLRKGIRWSDGHPFTADDIEFWYQDVLKNKELSPGPPQWLTIDGELVQFKKLSPFEVLFSFPKPNSFFIQHLAQGKESMEPVAYPKHWLKKFHKTYNPQGLGAEIEKAGAKNWVELFKLKTGDENLPKSLSALFRHKVSGEEVPKKFVPWPTLNAWMLSGLEDGSHPRIIAERNPYYWKVDPGGRQLPYIDRVVFHAFKNRDEVRAFALEGGVGMQLRRLTDAKTQEALENTGENTRFNTFSVFPTHSNTLPIVINLTHRDKDKRELFGNINFRIALSHAINREKIIATELSDIKSIPYQVGPLPQSRFYNERLATQYLDNDPDKANRILDGIGMEERDAKGMRLGSNGNPLEIRIMAREDITQHVKMLEMVAADWRTVGIAARVIPLDRAVLEGKIVENDFDVSQAQSDGGIATIIQPMAVMPWNIESAFGIGWYRWLTTPNHPQALIPPKDTRKQIDLYRQIQATIDPHVQDELMNRILNIAADQFYLMGISLPGERKGVMAKNFRNVPKLMPWSWTYPTPAPTNPSQYYIEGGVN